jgi:hypothetical protein
MILLFYSDITNITSPALPHQKCNREAAMPHFEKANYIKADYPVATAIGGQHGVNHERKNRLPDREILRVKQPGGKISWLSRTKLSR